MSNVSTALNIFSQVVGFSRTAADTATHAFLWTKLKGIKDLGMGGNFSRVVEARGKSREPSVDNNPTQKSDPEDELLSSRRSVVARSAFKAETNHYEELKRLSLACSVGGRWGRSRNTPKDRKDHGRGVRQ